MKTPIKTPIRIARKFFLMHKVSNIPVFPSFNLKEMYNKVRELNNPQAYQVEEFNNGHLVATISALQLVESYKSETLPITLKSK